MAQIKQVSGSYYLLHSHPSFFWRIKRLWHIQSGEFNVFLLFDCRCVSMCVCASSVQWLRAPIIVEGPTMDQNEKTFCEMSLRWVRTSVAEYAEEQRCPMYVWYSSWCVMWWECTDHHVSFTLSSYHTRMHNRCMSEYLQNGFWSHCDLMMPKGNNNKCYM